jgi:hypothetical protein
MLTKYIRQLAFIIIIQKSDKLLELVCLLDEEIEKSSVLTDIVMERSVQAIDHLQGKVC